MPQITTRYLAGKGNNLSIVALPAPARLAQLATLAWLLVWMAYTKMFWVLRPMHLVIPPCPFYVITGHPCPFCGGTRSFASMWRGDLGGALRYYPLGPVLFVATFGAIAYLAVAVVLGRKLWVPERWIKVAIRIGLVVLGINWALKIFWLGNSG